jgi:tetratricopeptide (TPR) repeat protein
MRTGDFAGAVQSNEHATTHDRTYLHGTHDDEAFGYYGHNLAMLTTAYAMRGDFAGAKRTADIMAEQGSFLQTYFVLVGFGRWNDITALTAPTTKLDGPIVVPMWHFARGMAFAATGDLASAQTESAAVGKSVLALGLPGSPGNYNSAHMLLGLAQLELSARIARANGDTPREVAQLEQAVAAYDRFLYTEPPDWYQPPREALGGALLRAGRYAEAENVFRADLQRNARNPRSLFGLAAALRGEGKADDAALVDSQFSAAWRNADTELTVAAL